MIYQYDKAGWFTGVLELEEYESSDEGTEQIVPAYSTAIAPETIPGEPVVGEPYLRWSGEEWIMDPYEPPLPDYVPPPIEAAPDKRLRWMALGKFKDRLGSDAGAIYASNHSLCKGVIGLVASRQYIDLDDVVLNALFDLMIAMNQPDPDPHWPGSGPLTVEKKQRIFNTPTTEDERYIKGLTEPIAEEDPEE